MNHDWELIQKGKHLRNEWLCKICGLRLPWLDRDFETKPNLVGEEARVTCSNILMSEALR